MISSDKFPTYNVSSSSWPRIICFWFPKPCCFCWRELWLFWDCSEDCCFWLCCCWYFWCCWWWWWYWWWYFWCCRCCCWLKFIIGSGCFALRVDNELVSVFWVSRSDWIILSFDFSSFSRDVMFCWRSVLAQLLSLFWRFASACLSKSENPSIFEVFVLYFRCYF